MSSYVADLIQNVIIGALAVYVFKLNNRVDRILQSNWFPPREER